MPFSKKKQFLTNWIQQFPHYNANLTDDTCLADIGKTKLDRTITVDCLAKQPTLLRLNNLLSKSECIHLCDLARKIIKPSTTGGIDEAGVNDYRTSQSAFLDKSHDEVVAMIEQRVADLLKVRVKQIEPFQIVKYEPGQQYKEHHDWFDETTKPLINDITKEMGGNRLYTIFAYLNDLADEDIKQHKGATCFPKADGGTGVCADPIMGSGIFWKNKDNGKTTDDTLHAGRPTGISIKWGLNIWIKEYDAPWHPVTL